MAKQTRRRFRFLRELAEGGFGKVYLAEMLTGDDFSTVIAVKLLHGKWADHDEILMRSRDEARLLGRLRHRNIVRVEDLTSINGQCAIVMEYLEGVDLKTMLNHLSDNGEYFPVRSIFEIIAFVAGALNAAYNHVPLQGGEPLKLIHRDIKPSNVMITGSAEVKLLDFGTARADFETREARTQALAFGSQAYMAPERMLGDRDTPAADVFSLGITFYELLTNVTYGRIFLRPERYEQALAERMARVDFGRGLPAELHAEAAEVLRLMLSYDSEDRPHATQVTEMMEVLAEDANDMGLRRFSRRYVEAAMESNKVIQDTNDPLTGSTLFEDRSASFATEGLSTEGDLETETHAEDDPPFEPKMPPRSELDALRGSGDRRLSAAPPPSPVGSPPAFDNVKAPAAPPPFKSPTARPATRPMATPVAQGPTTPATPPAPKKKISGWKPVQPTPAATEPTPPATIDEPDDEGGAGKKIVAILAAALVVCILGGVAAVKFLGGPSDDPETPETPEVVDIEPETPEVTPEPDVEDPPEENPDPPPEVTPDPPPEVTPDPPPVVDAQPDPPPEDNTPTPDGRGGVELVLKPLGGGTVYIYNQDYNYGQTWDGSGKFSDGDMVEGEYWTKVTPQGGGEELWRTVEIKANQVCKYRLDINGGGNWEMRGCK